MPAISDFRFIRYANAIQGFLLMQTKAKILQKNYLKMESKSMHKQLTIMKFNFGSKCKSSLKLLLMWKHLSMSAKS